ncbi:MAG TPA: MBL fold metallo-hydrolase [Ignavibacteriaceae bacterium]|nr:MBL fold metallo-hydrolase [Ignavibacteriaceae bacterium]
MLQLKKFTFNMFAENTFIIWDDTTKEAAVVDPGCSNKSEEYELENFIIKNNLQVKYLINTHCHIDHIFGCDFIKNKFNPIYLAPEKDLPLLQNAKMQSQMVGIQFSISSAPDQYLTEQTKIKLGNSDLIFLFTPGHTAGEFCILLPDIKSCITGDVLFYDSIGRTDLWGGDYDTLLTSIKDKLLALPDETKIYSGHGDDSTIGRERKANPFLRDIN